MRRLRDTRPHLFVLDANLAGGPVGVHDRLHQFEQKSVFCETLALLLDCYAASEANPLI